MSAPAGDPPPLPAAEILAAIEARRYPEAVALAEGALRVGPARAEVWNALGVALRVGGDARAALACHRRALELSPESVVALVLVTLTFCATAGVAIAANARMTAHTNSDRMGSASVGLVPRERRATKALASRMRRRCTTGNPCPGI